MSEALCMKALADELRCVICLSLSKPPIARLNCCHSFCRSCLQQALQREPRCPLCKKAASRRDISGDNKLETAAAVLLQLDTTHTLLTQAPIPTAACTHYDSVRRESGLGRMSEGVPEPGSQQQQYSPGASEQPTASLVIDSIPETTAGELSGSSQPKHHDQESQMQDKETSSSDLAVRLTATLTEHSETDKLGQPEHQNPPPEDVEKALKLVPSPSSPLPTQQKVEAVGRPVTNDLQARRKIPARLQPWTCSSCTFENTGNTSCCSMCGGCKRDSGERPTAVSMFEQQEGHTKGRSRLRMPKGMAIGGSSVKIPASRPKCQPEGTGQHATKQQQNSSDRSADNGNLAEVVGNDSHNCGNVPMSQPCQPATTSKAAAMTEEKDQHESANIVEAQPPTGTSSEAGGPSGETSNALQQNSGHSPAHHGGEGAGQNTSVPADEDREAALGSQQRVIRKAASRSSDLSAEEENVRAMASIHEAPGPAKPRKRAKSAAAHHTRQVSELTPSEGCAQPETGVKRSPRPRSRGAQACRGRQEPMEPPAKRQRQGKCLAATRCQHKAGLKESLSTPSSAQGETSQTGRNGDTLSAWGPAQRKWVLLASGLSSEEKELLDRLIATSGARRTSTYETRVTHVVCGTHGDGHAKRTLKFILGVLNGKWVVNCSWLAACLKAGQPVTEDDHEVQADHAGKQGGPLLARLHQGLKLLKGWQVHLHGIFKDRRGIEDVVRAAGAKLLTRLPPAEDTLTAIQDSSEVSLEAEGRTVVLEAADPGTQVRPPAPGWQGVCVSQKWLMDSASNYTVQNMTDYLIVFQ